jgi:hypothetical protein
VEGVTRELAKLPQVTGGLKNAFENLGDASTVALAKLGTKLNETFNIEGLLGKVADFLGGPVSKAIDGFAAGAGVVVREWDKLVSYFTTGVGGRIFGDLAAAAIDAVRTISKAFNDLGGLDSSFAGLVSASGIVKQLFEELAVGITAALNVVSGAIKGISALLSGDFVGALAGGRQALDGLVAPIRNLLGGTQAAGQSMAEFFGVIKQAPESIPDYFADVPAQAAKVALLTKEQQKAAESLAKLRTELRVNGEQSTLLGPAYDFVGERAKILEKGVKSLLDNGFAPGSAVVGAFTAELRSLNTVLGDNASIAAKGIEGLNKLERPGTKDDLGNKIKTNPLDGSKIEADTGPPKKVAPLDSTAFAASVNKVKSDYDKLGTAGQQALLTAASFNSQIESVLVGGMTQVAVGFGEAIGQIVAGGAGLEALPGIVLGAIGTLAIQVGQLAIGTGIAVAGIKAALESLNPVLAIAGGIALVALGTAVKSYASGLSKGSGGSASSITSAGSLVTAPRTPTAAAPLAQQQPTSVTIKHEVTVRQHGAEMIGTLEIATNRMGRTLGTLRRG